MASSNKRFSSPVSQTGNSGSIPDGATSLKTVSGSKEYMRGLPYMGKTLNSPRKGAMR